MADSARPARPVLVQRLVLLGLLAPIVALGVVFWLLLPGGAASASFSPGEFSRAAQLEPQTWAHRDVSLRGYLAPWCSDTHGYPARDSRCGGWLLLDSPAVGVVDTPPSGAVHVLSQGESGWHRLLRRVFPGLTEPFPAGRHPGERITITGTLDGPSARSGAIALLPKEL